MEGKEGNKEMNSYTVVSDDIPQPIPFAIKILCDGKLVILHQLDTGWPDGMIKTFCRSLVDVYDVPEAQIKEIEKQIIHIRDGHKPLPK